MSEAPGTPPDGSGAASDASLLARAASGDVEALAALYDRHAGRVLALCRRILANDGEAQDLVHDVFIEAWLAARDYDAARSSVRTWLLVRTRSRALDRRAANVRENDARRALPTSSRSSQEFVVAPPTERELSLRQGLSALDPAVREVLELTYFEGLTAPEAAERTQVPLGTVKSRLARGLTSLQQLLSDLEDAR